MPRPVVMSIENPKPKPGLLKEIQKGVPLKKSKAVPVEKNVVAEQIKLHTEVKQGVELNKVTPPNDDLPELIKEAYLAEKKASISEAAGAAPETA
ncbi:WH2 domain-containing protein [Plasmodiophora brassicae]|uniref:WH2 domain-containing protein n=1 Tax=Plasmodiophora brassicae TaxID=37360 RepID=A0A0G4IV51_PLABS|nr:hypothetical protein PBRA_001050 [Plasmodiophora brassicae]